MKKPKKIDSQISNTSRTTRESLGTATPTVSFTPSVSSTQEMTRETSEMDLDSTGVKRAF
jgi:hypothetical protein